MSDQENIKPDEESDVEAHKKPKLARNDGEAQGESTEDDDVELHKKPKLARNDSEAQDDSKEDDDVELHGRTRKLL